MDGGPRIRSTPPGRRTEGRLLLQGGEAVSTFGCSLEPCVLAAGSQRSLCASSMAMRPAQKYDSRLLG